MAIRAEDLPISPRQTLALDIDLLTGDTLARQIDKLGVGPQVGLLVVNTPHSKDNGKLLATGTGLQMGILSVAVAFHEGARAAGASEERLASIIPEVLQSALKSQIELDKAALTARAREIMTANFLDLQRTRYGF